jgi:UDP-N-acetylglucosamine transferase subunit ALG13
MKGQNFNRMEGIKRVLVAPLDWGLGHATRCIPLIKELLLNDCEVLIAADGAVASLLKAEFPALKILLLKNYGIRYSRGKSGLPFRIFLQLPKILWITRYENKWLQKVVKEQQVDLVIADNRPGMYCKNLPSVYITHQLLIKAPFRFTERIMQKFHYFFINRFTECWIPDAAGEINLAGDLSHPEKLPSTPVTYIGPLSRFEKQQQTNRVYDLLFILSGPEPQRSIFEGIILDQLKNFKGRVALVRGLPSADDSVGLPVVSPVQLFNHLSSEALCNIVQQSKLVVSRAGYTTVMDLVKLQQKAVLVPTPGQTEQEYLATALMEKKIFYCINQEAFDLNKIVEAAKAFAFVSIKIEETYKKVIHDLISGPHFTPGN